jgi:hypothetical protein
VKAGQRLFPGVTIGVIAPIEQRSLMLDAIASELRTNPANAAIDAGAAGRGRRRARPRAAR